MWALRFTLCELESVLYFIWLRRRVRDSRTESWSGPHGTDASAQPLTKT